MPHHLARDLAWQLRNCKELTSPVSLGGRPDIDLSCMVTSSPMVISSPVRLGMVSGGPI